MKTGPELGLLGVTAAVAVILAVAASTTARSGPVNACALLKTTEVAAAMNLSVTEGERRDDGEIEGGEYTPKGSYSSTCIWRVTDDSEVTDPTRPLSGKRFAILNAITWPKGSGAAPRFLQSFHDAAKREIIPHAPIPLQGIGDEALWWGDGVAVAKGDVSFGISVFLQNGDKETQRAAEEALAKRIAGRI